MAVDPSAEAISANALGCVGGDDCPLVKGVASNVEEIAKSVASAVPSINKLVSPEVLCVFTRSVCEGIACVNCQAAGAQELDLSDTNVFPSGSSIAEAVSRGLATVDQARSQLLKRMDAATDRLALDRLSAALDAIRSMPAVDSSGPGYGVLQFIFAKVGVLVDGMRSGILRLPGAAVKSATSAASELKAVIRRPGSQTEFYEMLHAWQWLLHALGVGCWLLVAPFVQVVVFGSRRSASQVQP